MTQWLSGRMTRPAETKPANPLETKTQKQDRQKPEDVWLDFIRMLRASASQRR